MTNTADAFTPPRVVGTDDNQEKPANRTRRARTSSGKESDGGACFFLAQPGGDHGLPSPDREIPDESEALVEAPTAGRDLLRRQEFCVIPELSRRRPQRMKEAAKGK